MVSTSYALRPKKRLSIGHVIQYSRGAQIPGARLLWRVNFVPWCLIFLNPSITLLAPTILMWLLDSWRICAPLTLQLDGSTPIKAAEKPSFIIQTVCVFSVKYDLKLKKELNIDHLIQHNKPATFRLLCP